MRKIVKAYVERFQDERRRRRQLAGALTILGLAVAFAVFWQLRDTGIAMTNETYCGMEEHQHDESCYEEVLVCGQEESAGHTHSDECYTTEKVLVCGQEESAGHTHTDECYTTEKELICGQEEGEDHTHTASCYAENKVLTCGQEESEGHTHTDACYAENKVLTCGLEESAGHTHTADCYEKVLVCDKEEHTHTMACMSNESADVETQADWESTLPSADELTGVWRDDLILVAQSQLGYKESSENYVVNEDGKKKGYTRYGAWYGNPYGDWCAMFVSFCLNYAGISRDDFPYNAGCYAWTVALDELGYYADAADYTPQVGDIVFFDWDGDGKANHVGIVEELETETVVADTADEAAAAEDDNIDENPEAADEEISEGAVAAASENNTEIEDDDVEAAAGEDINGSDADNDVNEDGKDDNVIVVGIHTIEGNAGNCVKEKTYDIDDSKILGYGILPEQPDDEEDTYAGDESSPAAEDADANEPEEGTEETPAEPVCEDGPLTGEKTFSYEDDTLIMQVTVAGSVEIPADAITDPAEESDAEEAAVAESEWAIGDEISADAGPEEMEDNSQTESAETAGADPDVFWDGITMETVLLDEDSDTYTRMLAYAEETDEEHLVELVAMSLEFYYGDTLLDMSDCDITVEVTATKEAVETAADVSDDGGDTDDSSVRAAMAMLVAEDDEVSEPDSVTMTLEDREESVLTASVSPQSSEFGIMLLSVDDPVFTVEYYATLPIIQTTDSASSTSTTNLAIIDTEQTHSFESGYNMYDYGNAVLPTNKGRYAIGDADGNSLYNIEYIELDGYDSDSFIPHTEEVFTRIYTNDYDDLNAHTNLAVVDKLEDDEDYKLKNIWVWNGSGDFPEITSASDLTDGANGWTKIEYDEDVQYVFTKDTDDETGKTETDGNGQEIEYIYVNADFQNTLVLLEYSYTRTNKIDIPALFFDYNITDGYAYDEANGTSSARTTGDAPTSGTTYVSTAGNGINSTGNYS
ncbi:MAG: CHAP domain-containing protein, partial [Clostridiales bacterium]|nr:CHAP domain-containing protein [Clostridiales bacterium]